MAPGPPEPRTSSPVEGQPPDFAPAWPRARWGRSFPQKADSTPAPKSTRHRPLNCGLKMETAPRGTRKPGRDQTPLAPASSAAASRELHRGAEAPLFPSDERSNEALIRVHLAPPPTRHRVEVTEDLWHPWWALPVPPHAASCTWAQTCRPGFPGHGLPPHGQVESAHGLAWAAVQGAGGRGHARTHAGQQPCRWPTITGNPLPYRDSASLGRFSRHTM